MRLKVMASIWMTRSHRHETIDLRRAVLSNGTRRAITTRARSGVAAFVGIQDVQLERAAPAIQLKDGDVGSRWARGADSRIRNIATLGECAEILVGVYDETLRDLEGGVESHRRLPHVKKAHWGARYARRS
jgi:hypothetical protein